MIRIRIAKTGEFLAAGTVHVERLRRIPTWVTIPLYEDGQLRSAADLAKLGLEAVEFTAEMLAEERITALYAANPDLAIRVRQYRDHLDALGLEYNATTDDIDAAITARADLDAVGRLELSARVRTAFQDIVVNLELMGCTTASGDAWFDMPALVKYLPELEASAEAAPEEVE